MKRIILLCILIVVSLFFLWFVLRGHSGTKGQKYNWYIQGKSYVLVPRSSDSYFLYDEQGEKQGIFYHLRQYADRPWDEFDKTRLNIRCYAIEYKNGESFFSGLVFNSNELRDALNILSEKKWKFYEFVVGDMTLDLNDLRELAKFHFDALNFARCTLPSDIPPECYPSCNYLSLVGSTFPPDFLKDLPANGQIEGLHITGQVPLNNADIVNISKIKSLKTLSLLQTWQNGTDLSPLTELTHLETLILKGNLDGLDLSFTSKMPSLKKLETEDIPPEDMSEEEPENLKK